MKSLNEMIRKLSPEDRQEVEDFVESVAGGSCHNVSLVSGYKLNKDNCL